MTMNSTQRAGLFYTILSIIGYSFSPIFGKKVLDTGLPAFDLATWRFALAMCVIWLLILARDAINKSPSESLPLHRIQLLALGSLLTASALAMFVGLGYIPTSIFVVLFFTYPSMVAVLGFFFGERLSLQGWIALALTVIGVLLTTPEFFSGFQHGEPLGYVLALASAFVVAVYFMLNPKVVRGHPDQVRASAWTITGAFVPLMAIALVVGVETPVGNSAWGNLIGLSTVSTVMSVFALMAGIDRLGATRTAIITTAELPCSVILAVLILDETMQTSQVLGGLLILVSIVLLNTSSVSSDPQ
jgi:drug/metabolite transporter (DMT)-like permease